MGRLRLAQPRLVAAALGEAGLVTVEVADRLPHGWKDWLQWNDACDHDRGTPGREEAQMLRTDAGQTLGLTRIIARRNNQA